MGDPVKLSVDEFVARHVGEVLKLQGFFPEFGVEHLVKVFPRSGLFAYQAEDPVILQGDSGADVYIIYVGRVKIIKEFGGAIAEVAAMGPGEILGEMALLSDGVRTATAVAADECQIYRVASADLQYILANNMELATHLKKLVAERLGR
jgi:CRP-like cAMP-binding protein